MQLYSFPARRTLTTSTTTTTTSLLLLLLLLIIIIIIIVIIVIIIILFGLWDSAIKCLWFRNSSFYLLYCVIISRERKLTRLPNSNDSHWCSQPGFVATFSSMQTTDYWTVNRPGNNGTIKHQSLIYWFIDLFRKCLKVSSRSWVVTAPCRIWLTTEYWSVCRRKNGSKDLMS